MKEKGNDSNLFFNLWVAEWVIFYNFEGKFDDGPNQTAEAWLLLLLGIDMLSSIPDP